MANSHLPDQNSEGNLPKTLDPVPSSDRPQPRVSRARLSLPSVEVVFSDALDRNPDHPLAGLSRAERQRLRLLKLAEILAEEAKRKAAEQVSKKDEEEIH